MRAKINFFKARGKINKKNLKTKIDEIKALFHPLFSMLQTLSPASCPYCKFHARNNFEELNSFMENKIPLTTSKKRQILGKSVKTQCGV